MDSGKIGQRIDTYMKMRGIGIEELSKRTGLDKDFINSMMGENVYPSLGPLLKLARALGVRLGTFLDDQISRDPLIIRKEEQKEEIMTHKGADRQATHKFHSLGRGKTDRHMEPFFIDLSPEQGNDRKLSSHEGEEFIFVTSGSIEVIYGKESYVLDKGDSIYYNSIVPHNVSCHGGSDASIVAVLYFPE